MQIRNGYCKHHNHGGDELEHERGHIQPQRDSVNKAENDSAQHHADRAPEHAAAPHDGAADEQRRQRDRDHARAEVYVHGFLRLRHKAAGQRRERVCGAQPDSGCKRRIDGRGAHHNGVIARRADGKPEPRAQEKREQHEREDDRRSGDRELVAACERSARERRLCGGIDRVRLVEVQKRRAAHHGNVHGIERRVDDDARKETVDAHARLQQRDNEAGAHARRHRRAQRQPRMTGERDDSPDGGTESEAAVGGHIADVEHGIAQIQRQRRKRAGQTQLKRRLTEGEQSGNVHCASLSPEHRRSSRRWLSLSRRCTGGQSLP